MRIRRPARSLTSATASEQHDAAASPSARRHRIPARVWWIGGAAALVMLAWGGVAVATTQHVFDGSTVSGIAVGGMSPSQAKGTLISGITPQLNKPVTVTAGEKSAQITPADSGISVNAQASIRKLTGFTLNPLTLAERLGGAHVAVVTAVDGKALTAALEAHSAELSSGTVDASVTLEGAKPVLTPATAGTGMDVAASVKKLSADWPLGHNTIALVEGTTQPAITDAVAQDFIDKTLTPLLSAPLTVTAEGTQVAASSQGNAVLEPQTIAGLTHIEAKDGILTSSLDAAGLHDAVIAAMGAGIERTATNASYSIEGSTAGTPSFVAGTTGLSIDRDKLAAALLEAGQSTSAGARSVTLPIAETQPEHNEAEADLGVKEIVGEYATPFYSDVSRNQNLVAGTAAINGTLIRTGETFSLEQSLGPVDTAHGFVASGVIINGEHQDAMGGGLSQVATTTFNAAFEAGMDDVEHHPHSYYFRRYPAGREATLWTGNLDVKWKNSTPYATLVQAWVSEGQVHVRLWSTKYYTVDIQSSDRTNIRPVKTIDNNSATCSPYSGGNAGFDITVTRSRTTPDGKALDNDVLHTSYQADNAVRCTAKTSGG